MIKNTDLRTVANYFSSNSYYYYIKVINLKNQIPQIQNKGVKLDLKKLHPGCTLESAEKLKKDQR